MIHGIKIYKGDGSLKVELSSDQALQHYNQNNESDLVLSPSERHWWKGFKLDDPLPKKHKPHWLPKKYKEQLPVYETICIICKKKTMKASKEAKYCGTNCYGISRRKASNEKYQRMKKQNTQ